jgi:Arc/MetJ-type ribon-helix-helix transcriptional regulator
MGRTVSEVKAERAWTRLPPHERDGIDRLVEKGYFMSRADAIRQGARRILDEYCDVLEEVSA